MDEQARALDLDRAETAAVAIGGGGVVALVAGLALGSRALRTVGLLAAVAGAGLFVREKYARRKQKIEEAQSHIRSELDDLDPVARAQVIAGLARSEL